MSVHTGQNIGESKWSSNFPLKNILLILLDEFWWNKKGSSHIENSSRVGSKKMIVKSIYKNLASERDLKEQWGAAWRT